MAKVVGPWDPQYPVNFVSDGDTTRDAFGKHIQEIERIYGLLNGIAAAKIEAEDLNEALTAHINSTNPHPNLQLTTLKGNLPFSRIDGSLDLSRTTGNLPSSRVSGNFSSDRITGNFGTDRITGLEAYVRSIVESSSSGGAGATYVSVSSLPYTLPGNSSAKYLVGGPQVAIQPKGSSDEYYIKYNLKNLLLDILGGSGGYLSGGTTIPSLSGILQKMTGSAYVVLGKTVASWYSEGNLWSGWNSIGNNSGTIFVDPVS